MVARIRQRWPAVKIQLRGAAGFCREQLMAWCERAGLDYIFGLAQNPRLRKQIEAERGQAEKQYQETQAPARVFGECFYATQDTWSRERRVLAKAEHLDKGSNPRFIGTTLFSGQMAAQELYEKSVLRAGRVPGESHQGTAVGFVCGSHHYRQDVVESTAAAFLFDSLCAVADAAAHRRSRHGVGESAMRNHPAEATQNRRASPGDGYARSGSHSPGVILTQHFRLPRYSLGWKPAAFPPSPVTEQSFRHRMTNPTPTGACVHSVALPPPSQCSGARSRSLKHSP